MKSGKDKLTQINIETYNTLFSDSVSDKIFYDDELEIAYLSINLFTLVDGNKKLRAEDLINEDSYYFKLDNIQFDERTKEYVYKSENQKIRFKKLSDYMVKNGVKKHLQSKERFGTCHHMSIMISKFLKGSVVTTGYVNLGVAKALHSVVEFQNLVYDGTKNIIMDKEEYDKLMGFTRITSIDASNIEPDLKILYHNLNVGIKPYLVFRDEIINDLNKNTDVLENKIRKRK